MPKHCPKCADRAATYRARALRYLPQAERTLDCVRERLRQQPPTAEMLAGPRIHQDMVECSLTARDLSQLLAYGHALATKPMPDREGFTLTVRYTFSTGNPVGKRDVTYHAVIAYPWPPTPQAWSCFLVSVYEPTAWFDADGYRLCWCFHPSEEEEDAV